MYNTKFIEITQGLKPGERILLSPPFEVQQKDIQGGVLADDERASVSKTNSLLRTAAPDPHAPREPAEGTSTGETPSNGGERGSSGGSNLSRNEHPRDSAEDQSHAPQGSSRNGAGGESTARGRAP